MTRFENVMTVASDASPVGIFLNTDPQLAGLLIKVQTLAGESGAAAYLVGGPVRDYLLGLPVKDLDVSVVGDAPALAARLADAVGGRLTVHQRFGTATVVVQGATIDLVTARKETYRQPGALPDVQPGDIYDDLARRDFTVNAMALPLTGNNAEPVDPHGGRRDLENRVIRTLHPGSFRDDPTRILRAIRYSSRLNFRFADSTLEELRTALAGRAISTISPDRIRHELDRIFAESDPLSALRLADDLGALSAIHPALSARHLPDGAADDRSAPTVWLSALVWPLRCQRSSRVRRANQCAVRLDSRHQRHGPLVSRLHQLGEPNLLPSQVCALLDGLSPDALTAATILAPQVQAGYIRRYLDSWWSVAPILRGSDLLQLGVPAGPDVGDALRALRKARLDGITQSRQDEEDLARQWSSTTD